MDEQSQDQNAQGGAPDLESMSTEQLEQHLDTQRAAPTTEQAPAPEQNAGGQGEGTGQALDPMSAIQKRLDEMHREMGRFRGLQSNIDKLDQRVEERIARILQEREQRAYQNSLPPEEREQAAEAQRREMYLRDMVRRESLNALQQTHPEYFQYIERAMEQEKDQQHLGTIAQMAEQMAPGSSQGIAQLFQKNLQELNSSDPSVVQRALEWNEKATTSPEFVVLELVRQKSQQVQQGAAQYSNAKEVEATKATIRPQGGAPAAGRKPVGEMSEAELEAMPLEQLEKMLPLRR